MDIPDEVLKQAMSAMAHGGGVLNPAFKVIAEWARRDIEARVVELEAERDSWKRLWQRLDETSEKHYEHLIQDRIDAEDAAGNLDRAAATIWSEGYVVGWVAGRNGHHRTEANPYRGDHR